MLRWSELSRWCSLLHDGDGAVTPILSSEGSGLGSHLHGLVLRDNRSTILFVRLEDVFGADERLVHRCIHLVFSLAHGEVKPRFFQSDHAVLLLEARTIHAVLLVDEASLDGAGVASVDNLAVIIDERGVGVILVAEPPRFPIIDVLGGTETDSANVRLGVLLDLFFGAVAIESDPCSLTLVGEIVFETPDDLAAAVLVLDVDGEFSPLIEGTKVIFEALGVSVQQDLMSLEDTAADCFCRCCTTVVEAIGELLRTMIDDVVFLSVYVV